MGALLGHATLCVPPNSMKIVISYNVTSIAKVKIIIINSSFWVLLNVLKQIIH